MALFCCFQGALVALGGEGGGVCVGFFTLSGIEIQSEKHIFLPSMLFFLTTTRPFQGGEVVNKEYFLLMGQLQFYVG